MSFYCSILKGTILQLLLHPFWIRLEWFCGFSHLSWPHIFITKNIKPIIYLTATVFEIIRKLSSIKRNWLFATNSDFLIPISLEPYVVNLWYFNFLIFLSKKSHSLKFQRFTTLESKDIRIRKSEFVEKSQFL